MTAAGNAIVLRLQLQITTRHGDEDDDKTSKADIGTKANN